jgi:TRAP-type C4-dicarboxylate transport system permease small subunit
VADPSNTFATALLTIIRRVEKLLAIVSFSTLIGVVFADVVSRELTGAGLFWASQVGVWANVFVVMTGFGLASADGAHLRPRFADGWLPASLDQVLGFLQHGVMSLFCIAIGTVALSVVLGSWQLGEVSLDLYMPRWPVQAMLPAAFYTAALRHMLYAFIPDLRPAETGAIQAVGEAGGA